MRCLSAVGRNEVAVTVAQSNRSIHHLLVTQTHVVAEFVDERVFDLGHDLTESVERPQYRTSVDLDTVGKS